jgi:hypothetical protein
VVPASFTGCLPDRINDHVEGICIAGWGMLFGVAIAMFVALVGWGADYFGWSDPDGKIQLAIITTFIMGVICGYKTKG